MNLSSLSSLRARRPSLLVGLLLAGLVGALPAVAGTSTVGSPSGGDPYFPLDGNGGYQVRHYTIRDRYQPATDQLRGTTVLRATATEALTAFHLDLVLSPDAVLVDGEPATYRKPRRHELRVTPAEPLAAGQRFTVTVRYHGRPGSLRAEGMTPGLDLWFHVGGRRAETAAIGEPQIGPWWFAANETPEDKARFDVTLRVPRGQQAVSNGALLGRERHGRWTAWHWRAEEPMVTYAAFFVAGRLQLEQGTDASGRPYVYAVSRRFDTLERSQSLRLLRRSAGVVAWLEDEFGPYPFATLGGVVSDADVGYALENQTRPVYPYSGGPRDALDLVVHEQAHQWFGDDVALRRWRDIWLNEGFATYAEWLWAAQHGGPSLEERLHRAYDRDADAPFWDVVLTDPGADHIWDAPSYVRGAMTLAALRARIGDADHVALLQEWASRNRRGHGTTAEFVALAEEVSGDYLADFFTAWLATPAKPAASAANGL